MASDVVIRAEGFGKKYLIGHESARERYLTLRDVVARQCAQARTDGDGSGARPPDDRRR